MRRPGRRRRRGACSFSARSARSPDVQDRLVAQAFRRGPAAEGTPFTADAGLAPIPPRDLLPATGGPTLASLAETWNRLGPGS
jgi:hypothetical protein